MALLDTVENGLSAVKDNVINPVLNLYLPEYMQNQAAKGVMQKLADQYAQFQANGQGLPDYQSQDIAQGLPPMTSLARAAQAGDQSAIKRLADYNAQIENARNATAQLAAVSPSQAPALSALAMQTNPLMQQLAVQGAVLDQQHTRAQIANEAASAGKSQFESLSPAAQNAVSFVNPNVQSAIGAIQGQAAQPAPQAQGQVQGIQSQGSPVNSPFFQPKSISKMVSDQVMAGFRTPEEQAAANERATSGQKMLQETENAAGDTIRQTQSINANLDSLAKIAPLVPWGGGSEIVQSAQEKLANFNGSPEATAAANWNLGMGQNFVGGIEKLMSSGGNIRSDIPIIKGIEAANTIPKTWSPEVKVAAINSLRAISNNNSVLVQAKAQSLRTGQNVAPQVVPYERAAAIAVKNSQPLPVVLDALRDKGYLVTPSGINPEAKK